MPQKSKRPGGNRGAEKVATDKWAFLTKIELRMPAAQNMGPAFRGLPVSIDESSVIVIDKQYCDFTEIARRAQAILIASGTVSFYWYRGKLVRPAPVGHFAEEVVPVTKSYVLHALEIVISWQNRKGKTVQVPRPVIDYILCFRSPSSFPDLPDNFRRNPWRRL